MIEFIIGVFVIALIVAIYIFICYWFGYYYIKWQIDSERYLFDFNNIKDCISVGLFGLSLLILVILLLILMIPLLKQFGKYIIDLL